MSELSQIQPFVQSYVLAIASVLEAAVTVVDRDLVRIGGSGEYEGQVGTRIGHDSFFRKVLADGAPGTIEDVRRECICSSCEKRESCRELANLAYPILYRGSPVGVIAIIAFDAQQRERLIAERAKMEEFLKYMGDLLGNKLQVSEDNLQLKRQVDEVIHSARAGEQFIGQSAQAGQVRRMALRAAGGDATVLITGESGTGKEVAARMIHGQGRRAERLMIAVNCGAIPESLMESELFGYERGAFTGARKEGRAGKFELAHHSTLFLDEIGDLSPAAQTRLLRVLQEREVERVGGTGPVPIDVRVICATNRDLEALVAQGRFRQDLFYRIKVIPLHIPPLRERCEDIPLLTDFFLDLYNRRHRREFAMQREVYEVLAGYHWPGNVRELKNLVEYLVNMVEGEVIGVADLPEQLLRRSETGWRGQSLDALLEDCECKLLSGLLRELPRGAEKATLAKRLGISRATLYRKLRKYGLLP